MFFLAYAEMRTFIVTCLLHSCLTNSNVLRKLAIRDLNNWVIQELLLGQKKICVFPVSRPYLASGIRNVRP